MLIPAVQYGLQHDADSAELRESLEREYPGYEVIVNDAPLSEGSRQKLGELLKGAGGMMEDVKKRALVSGLLAYADMAQVDRAATFWQTRLLPLARRCAGPAADKPLVEVGAGWRRQEGQADKLQASGRLPAAQRLRPGLDGRHRRADSGERVGRKSRPLLLFAPSGDGRRRPAHAPSALEKRRLDFTNTINVTWSVWADQGRVVDRQEKLSSPQPNPDPAGWRKDYLAFDAQYQAEGEALGAVMQSMVPLPVNPAGQRSLVREAAAPGTSYVFRLAGQGKSGRTLVLRFLRFEPGPGGVEAEVFDPGNHQPLRAKTPIWKGQLNSRGGSGIDFVQMPTGRNRAGPSCWGRTTG